MQSYIVRIYRSDKENPRTLIGTVEKVGRSGRNAFTSIDEMWEILNRWPRASAGRGRSAARKKRQSQQQRAGGRARAGSG